jgi:AAA domain, putative AbiEii toxin, Type IV TA system/AAA domain
MARTGLFLQLRQDKVRVDAEDHDQQSEVSMHVARLEIAGIRGFYGDRSVDLDFRRPDGSLAGWTVLAGRNASGKSTFLQALGLALAGPRSTSIVPNLYDWISSGVSTADVGATLETSSSDYGSYQPLIPAEPRAWMHFEKFQQLRLNEDPEPLEPEVTGEGLDTLSASGPGLKSPIGWFYAGYGPFRHLGTFGTARTNRRVSLSKRAQQVASLFDESISLADAVDWLIAQRLLEYENHPGATSLLNTVVTLLNDGLLPDGFRVSGVSSEGLMVTHQDSQFSVRDISDGYRAVTALVVDIIRQMNTAYRGHLELTQEHEVPALAYPGVVLIDEIDAHLHVSWQKTIGTWLKRHFPGIQFIVTTHSPYVCQSADPGGLILLPGPGENRAPHVIDEDVYERVVYGSSDDAILTELFGVDTPYSEEGERLRQRLGELEIRILDGSASDAEVGEYTALSERLTSSLGARVDEVAARLRREH